jgi:hypothetical protein
MAASKVPDASLVNVDSEERAGGAIAIPSRPMECRHIKEGSRIEA